VSHPVTERGQWESGGDTRHLWSCPWVLAHQPLPKPSGASSAGDGGSCPALLALTAAEGRQWEAGEAVRMVVKMAVKEDCSRVCVRMLNRRAEEREVVVHYVFG